MNFVLIVLVALVQQTITTIAYAETFAWEGVWDATGKMNFSRIYEPSHCRIMVELYYNKLKEPTEKYSHTVLSHFRSECKNDVTYFITSMEFKVDKIGKLWGSYFDEKKGELVEEIVGQISANDLSFLFGKGDKREHDVNGDFKFILDAGGLHSKITFMHPSKVPLVTDTTIIMKKRID